MLWVQYLQVLARRRLPAGSNVPEESVGLVEPTALQGKGQPSERLEAEKVVQDVPGAAVVGSVVERRRVRIAPGFLGCLDHRLGKQKKRAISNSENH